jgi:hypothetical protein
VRNPEDGTYPVWQTGVEWTHSGSGVEGAQNSMRGADKRLPLFREAESTSWRAMFGLNPEVGATTREELQRLGGATGWSAGIPDRA